MDGGAFLVLYGLHHRMGLKYSTGTMAVPWCQRSHDSQHQAKTVENGTGIQSLSSSVKRILSPMLRPLLTMLRWVSITPLGKPVVPEVYCKLMTSSGDRLSVSARSTFFFHLLRRGRQLVPPDHAGRRRIPARINHLLQTGKQRIDQDARLGVLQAGTQLVDDVHIIGVLIAVGHHQHLAVGLPQQIFQLKHLVAGVHRDQTAPIFAVANSVSIHSGVLVAQIAT